MYLHFPNFVFLKWTMIDATIKRKPIYAYYLLFADSIKLMLGTWQKEVALLLMWQLSPQGRAACLGVFGKMSGIDCRRFLRSPHPFPLLLSFRPPTQFRFLRVSFWKRLLRRLIRSVFHWLIRSNCQRWVEFYPRGGSGDFAYEGVAMLVVNFELKP